MNKKIILNHKSYLNYDEIVNYKKEIEKIKLKNHDIILFPSILYLSLFKDSKVGVGAQDFYSADFGSYTGEVSLEALKYMNINYTLIGHAERRKFELETEEITKEKIIRSLDSNFKTILLVGERTKKLFPFRVVKSQLDYYLNNTHSDKIGNLSIGYDPAWAIEGKQTVDVLKVSKMVKKIKKYLKSKYKKEIEVYYGGSISEDSIKDIIEVTDGVLIGKRSTDIEAVKKIIKIIS